MKNFNTHFLKMKENINYHINLSSYDNEEKSCYKILNLLDKVECYNLFFFLVKFHKYIDHNFFLKFTEQQQKQDLLTYQNYCKENNLKFIILLDADLEAPTYRYNLNKYCKYITKLLDIPLSDIILFSESFHQYGDNINFVASHIFDLPELKEYDFNNTITHHFISLARIAKCHRIYLSTKLIDQNLIEYGKFSLGSGYYYNNHENFLLKHIPEKYNNYFPSFIDGIIDNSKRFVTTHPSIKNAFLHIVNENASEPNSFIKFCDFFKINKLEIGEANYKSLLKADQHTWHVNSLTEISMKPFFLGQVPIFNCINNNLQYVRNLGFDLFDDLVNHDYDKIDNMILRIDAVIEQVKKICDMPLYECIKFKEKNMERFIKNRKLAESLFDGGLEEITLKNLQIALKKYV